MEKWKAEIVVAPVVFSIFDFTFVVLIFTF